jgi:ribosome-associated translation inhibitor RaiA
MRVHLTVSGHDLAPSLRTLIEQHFRFAASPFRSALQAIHVRLTDAVNPGSGVAKLCEAQLQLRDGGVMKIRRLDTRAEHAIQRVAERVSRSLRSLRRRRGAKSVISYTA